MNFSLITCTYNPDRDAYRRCVRAITNLTIPEGAAIEYIIVDNNSPAPVSEIDFVKEAQKRYAWISVLTEQQQGVAYARVTGIKHATHPIVIFFDDDNEPAPDYLVRTSELMAQYPEVAVWGAGKITVEFTGPVPGWVLQWRHIFQEREEPENRVGAERRWQDYYPLGTGQVIRKHVLEAYVWLFDRGELSCKSRTGRSLTSGEDVQIVFLAVKGGYQVGTSPRLHINHLTPLRKATFDYIKRLHFGTASSYNRALVEVYPEEKPNVRLTSFKQFRKQLLQYWQHDVFKWGYRKTIFQTASFAGDVAGQYYAHSREEPPWLKHFIRIMKFK